MQDFLNRNLVLLVFYEKQNMKKPSTVHLIENTKKYRCLLNLTAALNSKGLEKHPFVFLDGLQIYPAVNLLYIYK